MGTSQQFYNAAHGLMFMTGDSDPKDVVTAWYELNATQEARVATAMGLWDDVSGFTATYAVDDTNLARDSDTLITHTDYFLGIPYNSYTYWKNALPTDWSRVAVGDIAGSGILGVNKSDGANGDYHEIYIDSSNEGLATFQLGSRAFETVIHELGHSVIGDHISGSRVSTVMNASDSNNPSVWYASTPMTLDIDKAISLFGATYTTRTGDDTYGFHASFSGPYRSAFDFNVNTRPLVTVFDNGGNDTLDASGFRDAAFNPRSVHLDLQQGVSHQSYLLDGAFQTFAVIYTTTWIENGVTGGGNDTLIGNDLGNRLVAGAGNDTMFGNGGGDTLVGGAGRDFMTGGSGYDVFDFNSVSETGLTTATRDVITDFDGAFDWIDVSTIDARVGVAGNQAFQLLTTAGAAFTHAGQIHWFQSGGNTYVEGNTDADSAAEFSIKLIGNKVMHLIDFFL